MRTLERTALAMLATLVLAAPAAAQEHKHGQKPDTSAMKQDMKGMQHGMKGGMQHHMKGMQHDMKGMMKMEEGPWKELNAFHTLLHQSHHPLMQSQDLGPAREHAEHLAAAADAWAASTAPSECAAVDLDKVRGVAADARAFAKLVAANGGDDEVKSALNLLHDRFRAVHQACSPKAPAK